MGVLRPARSALLAMSLLVMGCMAGATGHEPVKAMSDDLTVVAQVVGEGDAAALLFAWTNQGALPVLLLTHVDTDSGLMFDAIEVRQGTVRGLLKSLRKATAPRFCVLQPGSTHSVRIEGLRRWLALLGIEASQPWQISYLVGQTVSAPKLPMPVCGAPGVTMPVPPPLWHGRVEGPLLRL